MRKHFQFQFRFRANSIYCTATTPCSPVAYRLGIREARRDPRLPRDGDVDDGDDAPVAAAVVKVVALLFFCAAAGTGAGAGLSAGLGGAEDSSSSELSPTSSRRGVDDTVDAAAAA